MRKLKNKDSHYSSFEVSLKTLSASLYLRPKIHVTERSLRTADRNTNERFEIFFSSRNYLGLLLSSVI